MKYTINDLHKQYPNDDVCLEYLFKKRFPNAEGYYRVKGRKCYSHKTTRHQIFPLAGTIFEKSSTPLTLWFHAIYLFSTSKNGVSAKELQRQLGLTYKCAWRMAYEIRILMQDEGGILSGTVEVDETYFGGRDKQAMKFKNKKAVMGMVERHGRIRANVIPNRETHIVLNQIKANVSKKATIMSDEFLAYKKLPKLGYASQRVKHGKRHWKHGEDTHTNTIEGFWGQLKRSIKGTYHSVSKQHLQSYVDEFAYRYNHRASSSPLFYSILERI